MKFFESVVAIYVKTFGTLRIRYEKHSRRFGDKFQRNVDRIKKKFVYLE